MIVTKHTVIFYVNELQSNGESNKRWINCKDQEIDGVSFWYRSNKGRTDTARIKVTVFYIFYIIAYEIFDCCMLSVRQENVRNIPVRRR